MKISNVFRKRAFVIFRENGTQIIREIKLFCPSSKKKNRPRENRNFKKSFSYISGNQNFEEISYILLRKPFLIAWEWKPLKNPELSGKKFRKPFIFQEGQKPQKPFQSPKNQNLLYSPQKSYE